MWLQTFKFFICFQLIGIIIPITADPLILSEIQWHDNRDLSLEFNVSDEMYYVLYHGNDPLGLNSPIQIKFPTSDLESFNVKGESLLGNLNHFFVVRSFSRLQPGDIDGDGLDDLFEWNTDRFNPLDETDASLDWDEDGATNLEEYRLGTNAFVIDTVKLSSPLSSLLIMKEKDALLMPVRATFVNGDPPGQTHLNSKKFEKVGMVPAGVELFSFDTSFFGLFLFE